MHYFISYLFRISVNWFFPYTCTAPLKHSNRQIPFCSFVWFSLSSPLSFRILPRHLAALLQHLPTHRGLPSATRCQPNLSGAILIARICKNRRGGWTSACTPQCQYYDPISPGVPSVFKQPHKAHVPSRMPSPGLPPWFELTPKAESDSSPNSQKLPFISPWENN